jgi:hypothetical protein
MERIPSAYRQYWQLFQTDDELYHLTTITNLDSIRKQGLLPRDPRPKYWEGMEAVFMAYPKDPLYGETQSNVRAHVGEKGKKLVRLHIRTKNQLFKSIDPERTFQVISLDPIFPKDIIKYELVNL